MALEGKIAKVLGDREVVLNRGHQHGVKEGMVFEIFAPEGDEVWDPDTGETLGTVEDVKAKAHVTEVKDKLSVARMQPSEENPMGFDLGEMQENIQRIFGQMFGENVQMQGQSSSGDEDNLESMLGDLQDFSKVQVGDAAREVSKRR
jgi:hypothetical protein